LDTSLKKCKQSLGLKAMCVALSVLMFFSAAFFVASAVSTLEFFGATDYFLAGGKRPEFIETRAFYNTVFNDVACVTELIYHQNIDKLESEIDAKREEEVQKALDRYLAEKAAIIEGELYYVATHYNDGDDGDGYYEGARDDSYYYSYTYKDRPTQPTTLEPPEPESAPERNETDGGAPTTVPPSQTTTAAPEPEPTTLITRPPVAVNPNAPANVRLCQEIISNTTGLGYLAHESLVRGNAFYEKQFSYTIEFPLSNDNPFLSYTYVNYALNELDARRAIERNYDADRDEFLINARGLLENVENKLSELVNFKYMVTSEKEGLRLTNMTDEEAASVTNHQAYLVYEAGKIVANTLEGYNEQSGRRNYYYGSLNLSQLGKDKDYKVHIFINDMLVLGDSYYTMYNSYIRMLNTSFRNMALLAVISLLLSLASFIVLLALCGHKKGYEGIKTAFIDRAPTDLHFAVAVGGAVLLVGLAVLLCDRLVINQYHLNFYSHYNAFEAKLYNSKLGYALIALLFAAAWALLVEWSASLARIKKAGLSFFKRTFVYRFLRFVFRLARRVLRFCKRVAQVFFYKPRHFRRQTLFAAFGYFVLNAVLIVAFIYAADVSVPGGIFTFALFAAFNAFVLYKLIKYIGTLDKVIVASSERENMPTDTAGMPKSLAVLAGSLKVTQDEMRSAVAKAVRDERLRTELITNVSHDLKTPLTAVISYVDLLKKCDISDGDARQYIAVLDEKSIRLKQLIEDLLEASKASSGNVTLNCTCINLIELTAQLAGEMCDAFEAAGLDLICDMPDDAPVIFADSQKTYRIIDNLLSNALKYSAPSSRVYMAVLEDGGFGVVTIKNISRAPLNISPSELTERFVRGDSSRQGDGNGLGLSIAKDLCSLQGGRLVLQIDGDLFKASVYLPLDGRH